jgi:hypothetical protein
MIKSEDCPASTAINSNYIVREVLKFLLGTILLTINIRLVYVLLKNRTVFSNVFYKFVILNGIMSTICHLTFYPISKYPILLYFFGLDLDKLSEYTYLMGFNVFIWDYTFLSTFIGCFFMSLDRMTSIANINLINWNSAFPYLVTIYFTLPFVLYIQLIGSTAGLFSVCFSESSLWNTFDVRFDSYFFAYQILFDLASFLTNYILLPATFIVNLITIIKFWHQRKQGTHIELTVRKHTKNLILIAFGDFVCH